VPSLTPPNSFLMNGRRLGRAQANQPGPRIGHYRLILPSD
jgi:hypothetical protein